LGNPPINFLNLVLDHHRKVPVFFLASALLGEVR